MSLHAIPTPAPPTAAAAARSALAALCAELRWRGWAATLTRCTDCGHPQGRLLAHGGTVTLLVEIPDGCTDPETDQRWRGIRIKPLSRTCWLGPDRGSPHQEAVEFAVDLLRLDIDQVAGRYQRSPDRPAS